MIIYLLIRIAIAIIVSWAVSVVMYRILEGEWRLW